MISDILEIMKLKDKKLLVTLMGIVLFLVIGFFALNNYIYQQKQANERPHVSPSQYAGQEHMDIKSLTADDIEALQKGTGEALGGLAKPAELSGYPGPRHVLDMSVEIGLSQAQIDEIQTIYEGMNAEAVTIGEQYIENEKKITEFYESRKTDEDELNTLLNESGRLYAELRSVHLSAHFRMLEILTKEQIQKYNSLRGYSLDPCQNVPKGHDPVMWRMHNNCK